MPDRPAAAMSPDQKARRLASRQHGLVTLSQLAALGLGEGWVRVRRNRGELVRCGPGVFRVSGAPLTFEAIAMSACLARSDAVLSHGSAIRVWGLEVVDWPETRVEITVRAERNPRSDSLVRVHRSQRLAGSDRCRVGVLPVTTPARTIFDLAPVLSGVAVASLVDDVLTKRLVGVPALLAALDRSSRRGLTGLRAVRAALDPWLAGPMDSQAEARLLRFVRDRGLPEPLSQLIVSDQGGVIGRVDFAWPRERVVLEMDGYRWHASPQQFVADRARWARLRAAGWEVIVATVADLGSRDGGGPGAPGTMAIEALLRRHLTNRVPKPS